MKTIIFSYPLPATAVNIRFILSAGFEFMWHALDRLYDRNGTTVFGGAINDLMSRADFWTLTSYVALERAARKQLDGYSRLFRKVSDGAWNLN